MSLYRRGWFLAALLAAAALAWTGPARAQGTDFSGNWKIVLLPGGKEIDMALVQIEQNGGQATGKLLAIGVEKFFGGLKLKDVQVKGDTLRLELGSDGAVFKVSAHAPAGGKAPKTLHGSLGVGSHVEMVQLEKTDARELDATPEKSVRETPARAALIAAFQAKGDEAMAKALREFLKEHGKSPLAFTAALKLLDVLAKEGAKQEELRTSAAEAVKVAGVYGPEMRAKALADVCKLLLDGNKEGAAAAAVPFAREAVQDLGPDATVQSREQALKTLKKALVQTGAKDEAVTVEAKLGAIEKELDQEFLKTAVPFKVEPAAGRKGEPGRTVLVELFTGAQCPPCVCADVAFDALLKTYKHSDVVLLQYHLHIPGPDALTNKDSEARADFYDVGGTPSMFLDGSKSPRVGGPKEFAEKAYADLCKVIDKDLEQPPAGQVKVTAARQGDRIDVTAEVSGLKKTGKEVRLHFALIEENVRYPGGNGQRFHHHIVRAMPGGVGGVALTEKGGTYKESVDLKGLRKSLENYLNDYAKANPFREEERPLELSRLAVVAFIQDDTTKEIVNAAQAEVGKGD